jgi:DNA primase
VSETGHEHGGQHEIPPAAEVLLSTVHLLVTVGFERTGLRPGSTPDLGEVELSVEGVRALIPLLERLLPADAMRQYRQALADLQMAFAEAVRASQGAPQEPSEAQPGQPAQPEQPSQPQRTPPVDTPPRPKIWTPRGDI